MIRRIGYLLAFLTVAAALQAQPGDTAPPARPKPPVKPGVKTPGVQHDMSEITPDAIYAIDGSPDWQVITEEAVWVANGAKNTIHRLDLNSTGMLAIPVGKKPCSGLAAGFGSIWVPSCGDKTLARVDIKNNTVVATIPVGPADTEGGVTASPEGVWMVTDPKGTLSRIDPATNTVAASVAVPEGSAACLYGAGAIWVTTPARNLLTRADPASGKTESIAVGPQPRFLTFGADSVWTLNQGDGSVTRVDAHSGKVAATIEAGVPGEGGEIAFGEGYVWVTAFQIPISKIDPALNRVVKQWRGPGGDSIRAAHGSVWLSNLHERTLWRIGAGKL